MRPDEHPLSRLSSPPFHEMAGELLEMIRAKAEGAEYSPVEAKFLPTNVTDIVARLKASIDQAEKQKKVKTARG